MRSAWSICCVLPTWCLSRGGCTRSHSEHGRETPQRQWYFVSRRGRVGRCQVCKTQHKSFHHKTGKSPKSKGRISGLYAIISIAAGWSSPVARQAHNLKAAGSNPAPATKSYAYTKPARRNPPGFWRSQKTLMPNTAHHVDERLPQKPVDFPRPNRFHAFIPTACSGLALSASSAKQDRQKRRNSSLRRVARR